MPDLLSDSPILQRARDAGLPIRAAVLLPHEPPLIADVAGIEPEAIEVAAPAGAALPVGERVRVELSAGDGPRALSIRAVVVGREETAWGRRYRLRACAVSQSSVRAPVWGGSDPPHSLYALANRRQSDRFLLTAPVKVGIATGAGAPMSFGVLEGASQGGCSLLVDADTERSLCAAESLVLVVHRGGSPDDSGPSSVWRIGATIAHRRLADGDIRYGCSWLPSGEHEQLVASLLGGGDDAKSA